MLANIDFTILILSIADSKQFGCDYAQAPIEGVVFSEKLTNQRNAASEDQKLYSDETQTLLLI